MSWRVVVEENRKIWHAPRWEMSRAEPADDRDHALLLAEQAAYRHVPDNPSQERGRSVFRCLDGSWLVDVTGVSGRRFHFRVTVAEWVADVPAAGS